MNVKVQAGVVRDDGGAKKGHLTWVTSVGARDHAVDDVEVVAGGVSGVFKALCGRRFMPASMCTAPGSTCPDCLVCLRAGRPRDRSGVTRREPGTGPTARLRRLIFGSTEVKS
jgi:hypothetical protein